MINNNKEIHSMATIEEHSDPQSPGGIASDEYVKSSRRIMNTEESPRQKRSEVVVRGLLIFCYLMSWVCILFVPVWKIIDTSYLFRERDDPSLFDKVKDCFSEDSKWPFARLIESKKDTYRVYFFIMPFCLGFLFLATKGLFQKHFQVSAPKFHLPALLRYRLRFVSVMDLVLISATLIYSAILLWVRTKRSLTRGARKLTFLYQDSKEPLEPYGWEATEVMAKTLGVLTITLLGWFVLMPIGRRSVLLDIFGVPWEVAVKYHRWLGWYTLVVLLAHTFTYIAVWIHANGNPLYDPDGNLVRHMMVPGSCNDGSCDSDREKLHVEMMYGFASLCIMIIMSVTAINYVRRRFFEIFYYTHQLFRLLIIFLVFHYGKTMLYLLPGVVMILIDKTIGCLSFVGSIPATATCLTKDIFELRVQKDKGTCCEAGQYVFVNVPGVSVLQWHPITVTWSTREELVLHIRSRGPQSWTQQVYDLVSSSKGSIDVKLDGFYGANLEESYSLSKKEAVLFVCGGCGLTFPFSIITELCQTNPDVPVYLHWVTRTKQEYAAFQELLSDGTKRFSNLAVSVWVTLNGHPANQQGTFSHASVPKTPEEGEQDDLRRTPKVPWRPYPSWLWAPYVHACVTAVAIFLGVVGYAVSRNHELKESMETIRALLVERFLGFLLPMLFAFAFLCVIIGPRVAPSVAAKFSSRRRKKLMAASTWTSEASMTSDKDVSESSDLDDVELGNAPFVEGTGQRPNFADIFRTIESQHDGNVVILACGPQGLVNGVRQEYQERICRGWTMVDEEWEW